MINHCNLCLAVITSSVPGKGLHVPWIIHMLNADKIKIECWIWNWAKSEKEQVTDEALCRGIKPRFRATTEMTGACTNRYTNRDMICTSQ